MLFFTITNESTRLGSINYKSEESEQVPRKEGRDSSSRTSLENTKIGIFPSTLAITFHIGNAVMLTQASIHPGFVSSVWFRREIIITMLFLCDNRFISSIAIHCLCPFSLSICSLPSSPCLSDQNRTLFMPVKLKANTLLPFKLPLKYFIFHLHPRPCPWSGFNNICKFLHRAEDDIGTGEGVFTLGFIQLPTVFCAWTSVV